MSGITGRLGKLEQRQPGDQGDQDAATFAPMSRAFDFRRIVDALRYPADEREDAQGNRWVGIPIGARRHG